MPPKYREQQLLSDFVEHGTRSQLKFAVFLRRFRFLRFLKNARELFLEIRNNLRSSLANFALEKRFDGDSLRLRISLGESPSPSASIRNSTTSPTCSSTEGHFIEVVAVSAVWLPWILTVFECSPSLGRSHKLMWALRNPGPRNDATLRAVPLTLSERRMAFG